MPAFDEKLERKTAELIFTFILKKKKSISRVPAELQVTRAVIVLSMFLSTLAVLVSTVGMKCTHFMDARPESKSRTAMSGGIMFLVAGQEKEQPIVPQFRLHLQLESDQRIR